VDRQLRAQLRAVDDELQELTKRSEHAHTNPGAARRVAVAATNALADLSFAFTLCFLCFAAFQ